jgi:hypothetical protein
MSAKGQKQTSGKPNRMSAYPPKADIRVMHRHVCYGPKADIGEVPDDLPRTTSLRNNLRNTGMRKSAKIDRPNTPLYAPPGSGVRNITTLKQAVG